MALDPRIEQRQMQLEAQRRAAAARAQGNSTIGNNEYTTVAARQKQNESRNQFVSDAMEKYAAEKVNDDKGGADIDGYGAGNGYDYSALGYGVPSYAGLPAFTSRYQADIDALIDKLLNRNDFEYDPDKDDMYQQYKKDYQRWGDMAMEDVIGKLSGKTGGLASSYATSAAQQTYNNYMAELAGKIPELRQLAYSMYLDEGERMADNLNHLINLDDMEYSRYSDSLKRSTSGNKSSSTSSGSSVEDALNTLVDSGAMDADTAASIYLGSLGGTQSTSDTKKRKTHSQGGR